MRVLQVIDQAFRTLAEEQDDTLLWLTRSMLNAGAALEVLFTQHAVQYVVQTRRQPALRIGDWQQTQPADPVVDVQALIGERVPVYAVAEDLEERGLAGFSAIPGVAIVTRSDLVGLYQRVDQVWHW